MIVLVPIDDTLASHQAIPVALEEADELVLATVGELPETSDHREDILRALRARLDEAASGIADRSVPVRMRVELAGDPVRGILAIAREEGVDRIVIASDEPSVLEKMVDGSTAEDLKEELSGIDLVIVPRR